MNRAKGRETKRCRKCGVTKARDAFYLGSGGYLRSACKSCLSAAAKGRQRAGGTRASFECRMRSEYGITVEDWARMYHAQAGRCAGCTTAFKSDRAIRVDHCHVTGAVRGLLCHGCNIVLGNVRDSISILDSLAEYLTRAFQERCARDPDFADRVEEMAS